MSALSKSDELFRTGKIFSASDEELDEILKSFATDSNSPHLNALTLTRVLITNTIKQQRHIDKIERRNQIYTWIIIGLTVVSIASSIIGILPNLFWLWERI